MCYLYYIIIAIKSIKVVLEAKNQKRLIFPNKLYIISVALIYFSQNIFNLELFGCRRHNSRYLTYH